MNNIKKYVVSTKNTVVRHKTTIAVLATAAAGVALNRRTVRQYNTFLEEKGLLDEFWNTEN